MALALVFLVVASAFGADLRVLDRDGRRVGEVRENPYGGVDIYDAKGNRLGYGRTSPYDPKTLELFDARGRRGIDVQPRKEKRR
jgi:hypothetical protein